MKSTDEKEARMQFLAMLDRAPEWQRTELLEATDYEELTALFCLCSNEYGDQTDVCKTLARIVWDKTPLDGMEQNRYMYLSHADKAELTDAEKAAGWHWCKEFDGLLVGPGMGELAHCRCLVPHHPMYKNFRAAAHQCADHAVDAGMCAQGCCDRYRCTVCGSTWTEEAAD